MLLGAILLSLAPGGPALADLPTARPAATAAVLPARLDTFLAADRRVAAIGWRLALANAPLCPATRADTGLTLVTPGEFGGVDRAALLPLVAERGAALITAVAPGSPAARAGILAFDQLLAVNGRALGDGVLGNGAMAARASFAGTRGVYVALDAALRQGPARLMLVRDGARLEVTLTPESICALRTQLIAGRGLDAGTDGSWISISSAALASARSDDELAFVLGHELAHVVRGDRGPAAAGQPRPLGRGAERAADRLALYLMMRAGYDPAAGAALFHRWGAGEGIGHLFDPTHPGFASRARTLDAQLAVIAQQREEGGEPAIPAELLAH